MNLLVLIATSSLRMQPSIMNSKVTQQYTLVEYQGDEYCEVVNTDIKLEVLVVYRPPAYDITSFLDKFSDLMMDTKERTNF